MKKVVVIGAGISGLATSALLAKEGCDVTVVEARSAPGGVAGQIREVGFVFDTGPTWYLMPEVFDRFFSHFGKKASDLYRLHDLDPSYKIFFSAEETELITRDLSATRAIFETRERGAGAMLDRYLEDARYKYDTALAEFLYRDYTSLFDFFNRKMILEGTRLQVLSKLDAHARRYFKDPGLRKILEYNIVFLGCSPFRSPAIYSLMSHVDIVQGVKYPGGGIYSLVKALHRVAEDQGVRFHFNSAAEQIPLSGKSARGVVAGGVLHEAEIVLSTADYHHTETRLLDAAHRGYTDRYWRRRVMAPSVFLMLLGVKKKIPSLEHHNLFLSPRWEEHFNAVFDRPAWPAEPSYYVGCPSRTDPEAAPEGCENLFVLVPVAPGLEDSPAHRESYGDAILSHLEGLTSTPIRNNLAVKRVLSINDFEARGLYRGTALGLAHTLFQTASFRPSRKSRKVKNLYYSGHYTHPGIGMPMVLISAEITAQAIAGA